MEFIIPNLRVASIINLIDKNVVSKRLEELMELEEDRFISRFHQNLKKGKHKACHNKHIKTKEFQPRKLVLMYDSKFLMHLGKIQMHWLGLYIIEYIIEARVVKLSKLYGEQLEGLINKILLKPY